VAARVRLLVGIHVRSIGYKVCGTHGGHELMDLFGVLQALIARS
jgi:hypothetical protein